MSCASQQIEMAHILDTQFDELQAHKKSTEFVLETVMKEKTKKYLLPILLACIGLTLSACNKGTSRTNDFIATGVTTPGSLGTSSHHRRRSMMTTASPQAFGKTPVGRSPRRSVGALNIPNLS